MQMRAIARPTANASSRSVSFCTRNDVMRITKPNHIFGMLAAAAYYPHTPARPAAITPIRPATETNEGAEKRPLLRVQSTDSHSIRDRRFPEGYSSRLTLDSAASSERRNPMIDEQNRCRSKQRWLLATGLASLLITLPSLLAAQQITGTPGTPALR